MNLPDEIQHIKSCRVCVCVFNDPATVMTVTLLEFKVFFCRGARLCFSSAVELSIVTERVKHTSV